MNTTTEYSRRRKAWRLVSRRFAVPIAVLGLVMIGPAANADDWTRTANNCIDLTGGPDDSGSCDAMSRIQNIQDTTSWTPKSIRGEFESNGEGALVRSGTAGAVKWRLIIPGQADPNGSFRGIGNCIEWGRNVTDCTHVGGTDIPEGKIVELEVCIYDYQRPAWICKQAWGVS